MSVLILIEIFVFQQFGGGAGVDMTKFPDFKFQEPKLDPITLESK